MSLTASKLRTFVGQMDQDALLDMLRFMRVVGGTVERIGPMGDGRYRVVLQHEERPLLASDLAALACPYVQLTDQDLAMIGLSLRACVALK